MYNPQLDTFLRVADAGSFNKAAEELYITPTAVIKQINLLEAELDVKLFERTHRGLTLTKAGKSLYQDTKYIIQYCRDSVTRAKMQEHCPDITFQIVPFENTPENAREILASLGTNIDVIGGIFDETMLHLRHCDGLKLSCEPLCCAVSFHHRLASKDKLKIEDLYGENLLLMHRDWSRYVDGLRDDIWKNHPQINVIDFDFYDVNIFNRCENGNDVLMAIPGWANVHPLLKVIPVEWEHCIPYGILHAPQPTELVKRFLSAAQAAVKDPCGQENRCYKGN